MNICLRFASALWLLSLPALADDTTGQRTPLSLDIDALRSIEAGKQTTLTLIMTNSDKGNESVRADELVRMHDAAFYVIITDETFSDYHYLPVQGYGRQNAFSVRFTPKHAGTHYLWADVTTLESSSPALLPAIIGDEKLPAVAAKDFKESVAGNYRFTLKLDRKPSAKRAMTGIISISRINGAAIEPGSLGLGGGTHVAGLYTDLKDSMLMRSVMLERPKKAKATIPAIAFYFTPQRAGTMRVFATFTINGQLVHVPFGITVAPERSGLSLDDITPDVSNIEMPDMPDIEMPDIELPSFEGITWERILP